MSKYFMFGKYSSEGFRNMTPERTAHVHKLVDRMGGKVCEAYALLGKYDIVFIIEQSSMPKAMRTSVALGHLTGITFSTYEAIPIAIFDDMIESMATEIESARMEAGE